MMTHRFSVFLIGLVACAGIVVLYAVDPATQSLIPCPFYTLFGFQCAGCGMTRAAHELLHGHVQQALHYNELSIIVLPLMTVALARYIYLWWHHDNPPQLKIPRVIELSALLVVLFFMILRNFR